MDLSVAPSVRGFGLLGFLPNCWSLAPAPRRHCPTIIHPSLVQFIFAIATRGPPSRMSDSPPTDGQSTTVRPPHLAQPGSSNMTPGRRLDEKQRKYCPPETMLIHNLKSILVQDAALVLSPNSKSSFRSKALSVAQRFTTINPLFHRRHSNNRLTAGCREFLFCDALHLVVCFRPVFHRLISGLAIRLVLCHGFVVGFTFRLFLLIVYLSLLLYSITLIVFPCAIIMLFSDSPAQIQSKSILSFYLYSRTRL